MPVKVLCCGILRQEMENLTQEKDIEIDYLDAALHVDFDKLAGSLTCALNNMAGNHTVVLIGTKCHPDMEKIVAGYGGRLIQAGNCIEMLLGDKMAGLDAEAKTFYLTGGWLENWRKIFIEGLKWDEVDARQNFGFYDRILLLDAGLAPIDEEKIIEFYDYTGVPVEIMPIDLNNLRGLVEKTLSG
ncbi:MAG: DUF1638 domain-containing protein [Bacillota bacterium]